jgi:hypothetical protein
MSNITNVLVRPTAGVLTVLTLACLGLAACGGSSGSSTNAAATGATSGGTASTGTTGTSTSTSGSSAQGGVAGGAGSRFAAIRECMQKNGVALPKRSPGSGGGFLRAGGAAGPQLPQGVTRAQYEAALKKCGGRRPGADGRFQRPNSPVFKQALSKFGACLRQNGINVPAPNTSGKGPIFSTKGIDTSSPQFKAATKKCRSVLMGAFRRPGGANGATGAGGAPPAGGQSQGGESSG